VCDLENLKNVEAMTRVGSQRHNEKKTEPLVRQLLCKSVYHSEIQLFGNWTAIYDAPDKHYMHKRNTFKCVAVMESHILNKPKYVQKSSLPQNWVLF
jgi:predicted metal-dependent HD superfamily phosphohydrolase